jgi:DNA-binding MarR family transcriptional regulator
MIGATITRANQLIEADYAKALDPLGISSRQLVLLRAIRDAKSTPSQTDLVGKTGMDRSTLADITRRMLKAGFVARKRTKEDARAYAVTLTSEGAAVVKAAVKLIDKIDAKLTAKYGLGNAVLDLAAFVNVRSTEQALIAHAKYQPVKAETSVAVPLEAKRQAVKRKVPA